MLSRETVLSGLQRLSELLIAKDVVGEIDIVGGAAMMLAFHARQATKDVDAAFVPAAEVRAAALQVATELSLPDDWLNDAAKGFLSPRGTFTDEYVPRFSGLRVLTPTAEYMLAMKVMASRTASLEIAGDKHDIAHLIRLLGLKAPAEAMRIVENYYGALQIPPRAVYLVEEIFEEMEKP